ncbi:MAG: pitrilysin family protein [Candidatus Eremiobacterota bacterium]
MEILLKHMANAKMVSINLWFKAGSNNEEDHMAGIAHFIEHMLFKGTEKRKVGEISKEIEELGGYLNGFTSYEATAYQITIPKENFSKGLEILLDALKNSSFDPLEIEKEGQVIIEECKMRDDTPGVRSWENLMKLAFKQHRYRRSIIGEEQLIKDFTRDSLLSFYNQYYRPENMILILAGDIKTEDFMEQLEALYPLTDTGETSINLSPAEGQQKKLRYNYFRGDIERTYIDIGFHIPDELHSDSFTMEILSFILGQGRSSRLYQELKEKRQLVTSIGTGDINGKDPGLFIISAVTDEDKALDTLKALWQEIEVLKKGVKEEELRKAMVSIENDYLFDLETVDGQSDKIGHCAGLGDYTMAVKYLDILKKTTEKDIKHVAEKYLKPDNCSISIYSPELKGSKDLLNISAEEMEVLLRGDRKTVTYVSEKRDYEKHAGHVEKVRLKNGVTLILEHDRTLPVVAIYAGLKGGVRFETVETNGICRFMNKLLIKGTKNRSAVEIAEQIESLGSFISPRSGKDSFGLSMAIIDRYLKEGLNIFLDVLNNPSFPENEIEKERTFILSDIREKYDDPMRMCIEKCDSMIFKNHPYGMPVTGTEKSIKNIRRQDIIEFYDNYVHGENLYISVVGNFNREDIIYEFEHAIRGKNVNTKALPCPQKEEIPKKMRKSIKKKDIRQSSIAIGFLAPSVESEDYINFIVLNSILHGMGSRLFIELRDIQGLAYVIFCYLEHGIENGSFKAYIGTSPEMEEKAIKALLRELEKVCDEGVTEEELQKAKNMIKGRYEITLQERIARATKYSSYEILGLGYERVKKYPLIIDNVKLEDVNNVAKKYFDLKNYSLSVIRPEKKSEL